MVALDWAAVGMEAAIDSWAARALTTALRNVSKVDVKPTELVEPRMPAPSDATSASVTTVTGSLRNDSKNAAAASNAADAAALARRLGPFFKTMSNVPTLL